MATTEDITIKITVDDDGAVKVLNQTGEELKGLGTQTERTSQGFTRFQASVVAANQALQLGKTAFNALNDQLQRATEVEGVAAGFQNLQGSAGQASETLNKLQLATKGLVSDFDLMQQANQAVLLGLPTEGMDELATAATKLGAATGRTAKEALGDLITGLGRASPLILDNLGITVKAAEAQQLYSDKLGVLVKDLTEAQKAEAFRAAAIDKIREKSSELADVQDTAATAAQRLQASVTNLTDDIATAASESAFLTEKMNGLADAVDTLRFLLNSQILEDFSSALAGMTVNVGKSTKALLQQTTVFSGLVGVWDGFLDLAYKAGVAIADYEHANKKTTEEVVKQTDAVDDNTKAVKDNASALAVAEKEQKKIAQAIEASRKRSEEWLDFQFKEAEALQALVERSDEYKQTLEDLEAGNMSTAYAADKLMLIYSDKQKLTTELRIAEDELAQAIIGVGDEANITAERMLALQKKVTDLKKEAKGSGEGNNGLAAALLGIGEGTDAARNADLIKKIGDKYELGFSQEGADAGGAFVAAFIQNISKIGSSTEESVQGITSSVGAGVGGFFGGAQGAAIGSQIGDLVGGAIGGLFVSNNAGKMARDSIDAFFEDALDANRLSLVIDGQLKEIKDIAEENYTGFFENLDVTTEAGANAFAGFDSIGRAIAEMFGEGQELASQFGAVLGNEVGGSLNNLQILLQTLNVSQEDLGAAIEEAWLAGDVSAQQFLSTQNQIANVYAKGIPDGVGRTDLAFQNLIESGGAGRQVVDALGDAAIEAQEKGISTLEGLREELIASGADAEKVDQAFTAIASAGITSLDALADVSVQSAATIASQLESTGTFFEDVVANIEDIQNRLDAIADKEVNVTFNVRTNVDEATRELGLDSNFTNTDQQFGAVQ